MVIRATRAEDIQDSLNIMANIILRVNTSLNITAITDNQGIPDNMDMKIMVITVTMVKRTKTKVQSKYSYVNFTTLLNFMSSS